MRKHWILACVNLWVEYKSVCFFVAAIAMWLSQHDWMHTQVDINVVLSLVSLTVLDYCEVVWLQCLSWPCQWSGLVCFGVSYSEVVGGMFLQNVNNHLPPDHTVITQRTTVWISTAVKTSDFFVSVCLSLFDTHTHTHSFKHCICL